MDFSLQLQGKVPVENFLSQGKKRPKSMKISASTHVATTKTMMRANMQKKRVQK